METKSPPLAPLGRLGKQTGLASQQGGRLEQMGRENGCSHEKEMAEPEYLIPEASMWLHFGSTQGFIHQDLFLVSSLQQAS